MKKRLRRISKPVRTRTKKVRRKTNKRYTYKVLKRKRKVAANARAVLQRRRNAAKRRHRGLLTASQIAKRYGVALPTVYAWKAAGLRPVNLSALALFDPKRVERFLLFARRSK